MMMPALSRRTGAALQRRSMSAKRGGLSVTVLRVRWVAAATMVGHWCTTTTPRTSIRTPGVVLPRRRRRRRDGGVVDATTRVPEHRFHSGGFAVEMMAHVRYGAIARDFRLEHCAVAVYFRFGPEVDEFVDVFAIRRFDVLNVASVFPSGIYRKIYSQIWKSIFDSWINNVTVLIKLLKNCHFFQ